MQKRGEHANSREEDQSPDFNPKTRTTEADMLTRIPLCCPVFRHKKKITDKIKLPTGI